MLVVDSWKRKWAKVAESCSGKQSSQSLLLSSSGQRPSVTRWHRSLFVGEDHTVVIVVTVVDHTEVIVACHKAATQPESNALDTNTKNAKTQRCKKMLTALKSSLLVTGLDTGGEMTLTYIVG